MERKKILVVDDNGSILFLLKDGLENQENEVLCCSSAEEALKSAFDPDVIVSDINMPGGMNGIELAKSIKTKKPTIPIILMTALTPLPPFEPADAILGKPFPMEQLKNTINRFS